MGALTGAGSGRDVWRQALVALGVSVVAAAAVGVVGGAAWLLVAVVGTAVVAAGLVVGQGALVIVGALVQVVAAGAALVATAPEAGVRPVSLLLGVLVWLGFELACASLERRPAPEASPAARESRVVDLVVVAAAGVAIGVLALVSAGRGPVGATVLRIGAMSVVVATLGVVWLLSRRRPTR